MGQIACKAGPNTDIGGAIEKLTGTASSLSSSQLEALPEFLKIILPVSPAQVQVSLRLWVPGSRYDISSDCNLSCGIHTIDLERVGRDWG